MPRKENNKRSMDLYLKWKKRKKERNSQKKQVWVMDYLEQCGHWGKVENG